ncbi:hypothetical protein VPHK449_0029 [Vibrio phage K449]|nr:hypothetical protein SIPHO049v1_p0012 [Vibrio phage PS14A.1]
MIHIKQIKTGLRVLAVEDDHDTNSMLHISIEVKDAREDYPELQRLDMVVFGVPYVGIIDFKVTSATMPLPSFCRSSTPVASASAYDRKYDYTIRLVAVEGYDYSSLITSPWS